MNPWGNQWEPTWKHPHVYVPPQYPPNYWDQPPWGLPYVHGANTANFAGTAYRSAKYPDLNPILATDTTLLRFDVAKKPRNNINSSTYHSHRHLPATATPVMHIRLISRAFPWSIDVKTTPTITCETIWEAIYSALQNDLADSEWGVIVREPDLKARVESWAKKRDPDNGYKKLKRIDWLGNFTMFKGLEKDNDFAAQRLLPGSEPCADTWVVRLGDL